jgi:hypothetical protein
MYINGLNQLLICIKNTDKKGGGGMLGEKKQFVIEKSGKKMNENF